MLRKFLLVFMVAYAAAFAPTRTQQRHSTFVGERSTHVTQANLNKTVMAAGASVVERVKEKVVAPAREKEGSNDDSKLCTNCEIYYPTRYFKSKYTKSGETDNCFTCRDKNRMWRQSNESAYGKTKAFIAQEEKRR